MYLSQQHLFRYKKISACNSESFHKTTLARTLHGSAATQSRWGDRFYSRYVCWSFLIARVKKLLKLVNRNQKYCKDKSSFVHGVDPFSRINQHFTRWCSICRDVFSVKLVHMVLLMQWCNGFKRSRTPPHIWSPALDGATTCRLFSSSCTGFQSANEFSSSWRC